MVDLARQAFCSKNFDLAAEIYERSISENGPKPELLLGLADSFAKAGHFEKAFTAYSKACRVGPITPKDLKHLVAALVATVKQDSVMNSEMNKNVVFDCLICRNMLYDPVTVPCGHTFCRGCLVKDTSKQCKNCGTLNHSMNVARIKSNVLLTQVLEQWFPEHCSATKLKKKANQAFQTCSFEDAIRLYTSAIEMAPQDHLLYSNRSHAYQSLDRYKEAMQDAESVLQLRPDWPKGYFRRGCALYGLGRYEESVVALLQCLALDSSIETAKDYLSKALHNIILPLSPDDPKSVELQRQLNPTLLDQLIRANFDHSLLLPSITVDTVRHLKEIISDTVTSAANFLEGRERESARQRNAECEELGEPFPGNTEQGLSRCQSAPSSRSGTPVMLKRKHSEASCYHDDVSLDRAGACGSSIGEPMITSPALTRADKKKGNEKDIAHSPQVNAELLDSSDFECSLCYRLLHLPVTTPCGHVFCRPCLDKVLDHKNECPLCKSCLAEYLAERRQSVTSAIENLLEVYFPSDAKMRKVQHEEEMHELASMGIDNQHEIPIFVCTLGFPGVTCPLHIFEPRYRLMVRQCMESGRRQFGMCTGVGEDESDFSDFGVILEIRDVQYFADGRSLVDTIGGKRFKVISRGQREGYQTAKVEFFTDLPVESVEEVTEMSKKLHAICQKWFDALPSMQQSQIRQQLGNFPEAEPDGTFGDNGSAWHWWMIAVLPLDPRIQLAMLGMTSYKQRLQGLGKVLGFLKNKRDGR